MVQLLHQIGIILRRVRGFVVQHPPFAAVRALHQAVQPQGLAVVHQLDLIALPAEQRMVPGPRGFAPKYAGGHVCGLAALRHR